MIQSLRLAIHCLFVDFSELWIQPFILVKDKENKDFKCNTVKKILIVTANYMGKQIAKQM